MLKEFNEKTTTYVPVSFRDKDGALAVPQAISYRVDCLSTNTEIIADTSFPSVASEIEITLPITATTIQDPLNDFERKLVTVTATYGGGEQVTGAYQFRVRNLSKIT